MKWIWDSVHYWPVWLSIFIGTFLFREVWALASKRPQDTLSDWVWNQLHVIYKQPLSDWDAAHMVRPFHLAYLALLLQGFYLAERQHYDPSCTLGRDERDSSRGERRLRTDA